jgi:hypothetical protein
MSFRKFTIISQRDIQCLEDTHEIILINLDHIVSVKPIQVVLEDKILEGYWIRTTNGKKYRSIDIPEELKSLIS